MGVGVLWVCVGGGGVFCRYVSLPRILKIMWTIYMAIFRSTHIKGGFFSPNFPFSFIKIMLKILRDKWG